MVGMIRGFIAITAAPAALIMATQAQARTDIVQSHQLPDGSGDQPAV